MWYFLAASLLVLQFNKKIAIFLLAVAIAIGGYAQALDWRTFVFFGVSHHCGGLL
ncbi:hypothetical protein EC835_1243 [Providencia alcalifaciens]|uniref:Uncharacterized protein n=1 Tax=Providencia alcalifaciens TaxID=126385 RepID=A0A4R3NIH4_9GAMM|nr:hypothetical protein EC835_1243 [Providencia alcalifaciens]